MISCGDCVNHLNDQVRSEARIRFALARGQFHVRQPVCAVPEFRGDQFLKQRMLRAAGHGNIAAFGQRHDASAHFPGPAVAVTLPGTTVSARTSSSGEFSASIMASASSVPGSVSMITFLAVAGGFVPAWVAGAPQEIATANARRKKCRERARQRFPRSVKNAARPERIFRAPTRHKLRSNFRNHFRTRAPQPAEWKQAILGFKRSQHETDCAQKFSTDCE